MKRTAFLAAGVMALGVGIVIMGKLWANPPAPTAPTGGKTKVGLVNLTHVIKKYEKFKAFQEELKGTVKPFQDKDNGLKKQMEDLAKEGQKPGTTNEKREQLERQMKDFQRQLEDNKNDAQKVLVKKQEEQLRILYMDVRNVVDRYAQAHGFDMVLHYNDAVESQDYWSAQNIARKMQAGALVPMYFARGLDISSNIIDTLNAPYKMNTPAAGGKAAAPAPKTASPAPTGPAPGARPGPGGR